MNAEQGCTGIYIKLAIVAAIWGSTFVAGRIVSAEMSAPFAALGRFVIATSTLLLLLLVIERGFPRLSARQWLFFIVLGVAVDLGNGNPLALITDPIGRGEVAMFGCVLGWTAYTLLGKRVMGKGISPLAATTCSALTGTAILVIVCALAGDLAMPPATLKSWLSLVYMGVVGTAVAYVWFYDGVARIGPARTAVFINLVPIVAITLGVLLLGEKLQASMLVGAALVVTGVWIINRSPAPVSAASAALPALP